MEKQTDQKRRPPISYRPPQAREEEFDALVEQSGLAVNAFITEAVFGRSRFRPAELQHLARILATCAQISDALSNLSQQDGDDVAPCINAARAELSEIRAALLIMMGRKP